METRYLVDTNSLTGYAQVLEELRDNGSGGREVFRTYAIGHNQISQTQLIDDGVGGEEWITSFYLLDAELAKSRRSAAEGNKRSAVGRQGSVWGLSDTAGDITDLYFYDAFGIHLNEWGDSTPNVYRYTGEQWDEDLGHYYLRARYYEPDRGRFWPVCRSHFSWVKTGGFIESLRDPAIFSSTHGEGRSMDPFDGFMADPQSLHKYLYAHGNPVMFVDPSGNMALLSLGQSVSVIGTLTSIANIGISTLGIAAISNGNYEPDGVIISIAASLAARGIGADIGLDVVYEARTGEIYVFVTTSATLVPVSLFRKHRGITRSITVGPIFNMTSAKQMQGWSLTATWPASATGLLLKSMFKSNKMWGAITQLAKRTKNQNWNDKVIQFGLSTSGPGFWKVGLRNNSFSAAGGFSSEVYRMNDLPSHLKQLLSGINLTNIRSIFNDPDSALNFIQ